MLRIGLASRTPTRWFSLSTRTFDSNPSRCTTSAKAQQPNADSSPTSPVPEGHEVTSVRDRIRHWVDRTVVDIRNRTDGLTSTTQSTVSQLGSHMNRVTGYEEIEVLKKQVVEQESRLNSARQLAREAKDKYANAVLKRASSQKEVNDLLQRKSTWRDEDEEARTKIIMDHSDDTVEREFNELMRTILTRYHEEQVWSDKIRGASTYGSLAVLGLNLVVFVMAIVVVEPWKRKKLAMTFENKIEAMNAEHKAALVEAVQEFERKVGEQTSALAIAMEETMAESASRHGGLELINHFPPSERSAWDGKLGVAVLITAALAGSIGWLVQNTK